MQRLHLKIYNPPSVSPPHSAWANVQVRTLRTFKISLNSACRCKARCFIVPILGTWRVLFGRRGVPASPQREGDLLQNDVFQTHHFNSLPLLPSLPFHVLYSPFSSIQTGLEGFFQIIETLEKANSKIANSRPLPCLYRNAMVWGRARIKST